MSEIEGIPEGYELVRIGTPKQGEPYLTPKGRIEICEGGFDGKGYAVLRKIEKPKRYRPFANAAEYFKNCLEGFAVDWKGNSLSPSFYAVVSASDSHVWVAFGASIERFSWKQALEQLEFRHRDSSTSPFGVEVAE